MMKTCKIILFCLLMSSVALSCGVARQTAQEHEALVDAIEDSEFILDITEIMPFGYPSRASTGEYALRVDDETVTTRLPFIGDSRMPMMSSDEISIVFEKEKVDPPVSAVSHDPHKQGWVLRRIPPLHFPDLSFDRHAGIFMDIAEQKRALPCRR